MSGKVLVTDANGNPPPPPPPPPLSEQPFPNDAGAPSAFEVRDAMGPRLRHVVVDPRPHGARVRLRLDEPALVTLRVERARLTVKRSRKLLLKGHAHAEGTRVDAGRVPDRAGRQRLRGQPLAGQAGTTDSPLSRVTPRP